MRIGLVAAAGSVALLIGGAATADVTARGVWQAWQDSAAEYGQTLDGETSMSGDTLTVTSVELTSKSSTGGTEASVRLTNPRITFTETGDGAVAIDPAPETHVRVETTPEEGASSTTELLVRGRDTEITASGTPQDTRLSFEAPEITATLEELRHDGEPVDASLDARITEPDAEYRITEGDSRKVEAEIAADRVAYDSEMPGAKDGDRVSVAVGMDDIEGTTTTTLAGDGFGDLSAAMRAGFASESSFDYDAADYSVASREDGSGTDIEGSVGDGSLEVRIGGGRISYAAKAEDHEIEVSGPSLPVPQASASIEETAFEIALPVSKTEESRDFSLLMRLTGVDPGEGIWAMLDPGGVLSHDPAALVVDLSGKGRWSFDPLAAGAMAAPPDRAGTLDALSVDTLRLDAAGAELTGEGDFTFDNTDLETFDGVPRPEGAIELTLTGAKALMKNLVQMGIAPESAVSTAQLMLGMFARPGEDDDSYVSKIEINADGEVLANGQALPFR